jgi:hypothetical protein
VGAGEPMPEMPLTFVRIILINVRLTVASR